jgi:DNA modification methylase
MFSKSEKYYFDQDAVKEPTTIGNGRKNKRTVWHINTEPCAEAHFAVFPKELVRPCILAGSKKDDLIIDPFYGAGTVGFVSKEQSRRCVGIELNEDYLKIAKNRTAVVQKNIFT